MHALNSNASQAREPFTEQQDPCGLMHVQVVAADVYVADRFIGWQETALQFMALHLSDSSDVAAFGKLTGVSPCVPVSTILPSQFNACNWDLPFHAHPANATKQMLGNCLSARQYAEPLS